MVNGCCWLNHSGGKATTKFIELVRKHRCIKARPQAPRALARRSPPSCGRAHRPWLDPAAGAAPLPGPEAEGHRRSACGREAAPWLALHRPPRAARPKPPIA